MEQGYCANCGKPIAEHCKVHLIPCCPGKCPKEMSKVEQGPKKSWPKKFLALSPRARRIINNFFCSRMISIGDTGNAYNWRRDCISYSLPEWLQDYYLVKKYYDNPQYGPIQEGEIVILSRSKERVTRSNIPHHPECQCNKCTGRYFHHGQPGSY